MALALRAARTALTGLSRRHEAISANVANIDTAGYQRREVSFERALESLAGAARATALNAGAHGVRATSPAASARGGFGSANAVTPRSVIASRNDGNTVSIDEEMALLAETQIRFQALTQTSSAGG